MEYRKWERPEKLWGLQEEARRNPREAAERKEPGGDPGICHREAVCILGLNCLRCVALP